jgi:beta-galactosidase
MKFEIVGKDFIIDGKPTKLVSGAVHYFRNLPETWDDIFEKLIALGCNCVETYCVWNMHEKKPGAYDFSGILDVKAFLQKAQKHGLYAIVRPGPYICAEWEFGGLPWWLQTIPNMEIRCRNKAYMERFSAYLEQLFRQVRPMLCTNGGNVLMLQVENEYGYYGDDKVYLNSLVGIYRQLGINVPLFTSDGTKLTEILDGSVESCFSTLNFGSRVEENFRAHDELYPNAPKMCMEMWNGWFDAWGDEKHHTTSAEDYAKTVDDMLTKGSLNMYMFIGGTNFGFTSGANHYETFTPDVTSYDYDALLTEAGDVTPKYYAVREVIQKHIGKELPPVPANRPKKAYGKVHADSCADLFACKERLAKPVATEVPMPAEYYGVGYGYTLYETVLNRDYTDAGLTFQEIGDRAHVFVDGRLIATMYVNTPPYETKFSAKSGSMLSVLVENMGRTNFGPKMMRRKGLVGRVLIDNKVHFGWKTYPLPMDNLDQLQFTELSTEGSLPFYKFTFNVDQPADTFMRLDGFGKGFAVLNGFNLGRYWKIGPQKTLFVPASLLKQGNNTLVVFDSEGTAAVPVVEFVDRAELG